MEKTDVVEEFFGVYLLKCINPKYKGRTYIGYTVDPNRRIKQHNKGKLYGGAWRTSQRGPWEMTLTVHGFPSDVAALRFEWAWQHPTKSRRLKSFISKKKCTESSFDYCLKVMFTMLRVPPWCRLPLTVRWLSADVMVEPPPNLTPPMHMPIVYGPVVSRKLKSPKKKAKNDADVVTDAPQRDEPQRDEPQRDFCGVCHHPVTGGSDSLACLNVECPTRWHPICLASNFLEKETSFIGTQSAAREPRQILPVEGCCPDCGCVMLWGDLVRKKKGCYNEPTKTQNESTNGLFLDSWLSSC